MATYVNNLRLKEIATGDESGTWGTSTNLNLELIGQALGYGTEAITTNADTHATTIADGAADEGRALFLKYTGTLDSACTITLGPNTVKKVWIIENATSGSQNIIISQGSGANITIAPGKNATIYTDGAGSGAAVLDAFADLELSSTLSVAGATTLTGAVTASSTLAVTGEAAVLDGSGLVIGHTARITVAGSPTFQILGSGGDDSKMVIGRHSANAVAPTLEFFKTRATSPGAANAPVVSGDNLGTIEAFGDDGTDNATSSSAIVFDTEGTIGTGQVPGVIKLQVAAAGTLADALTISSAKAVAMAGTLAVGGALVSTELFAARMSNATVLATVPAVARFSNDGSGYDVKILLSDNNLADAWITFEPSATATSSLLGFTSGTSTPQFTLDGNGLAAFTGAMTVAGNTSFNAIYRMTAVGLSEYATNGVSNLPINYRGYNDGTTQFRNLTVYDGKQAAILTLVGSTKAATLTGALAVTGTSTLTGGTFMPNNVFMASEESGGTDRNILGMDSSNRIFVGNVGNNLTRVGAGVTTDFIIGGTVEMTLNASGLFIGDTSNANMTQGLTINQGAADDEILALKSSDVAHGMTGITETDTYGVFKKVSSTSGGLTVNGYTDTGTGGALALALGGVLGEAAQTTKTTGARGIVNIDAAIKSGTGKTAAGADANLIAMGNDGTTRFIFDAEGSAHADVEWTTF